jgi:hypothetical protein
MSWSAAANQQMGEIQAQTGASAADMGQLLTQINTWVAGNQNGTPFFAFGRHRDHGVTASVTNGEVIRVSYGDRLV